MKALTVEEINESYIEKLKKFDEILENLKNPDLPPSKAIKEQCKNEKIMLIVPEVEKLKIKIIGRIRNFLIATMEALKKPRTNIQIIQQSVLLKFKELTRFLRSHGQGIYLEVSNYYCELMCGLYMGLFKSYITEISKLGEEVVGKNESIIVIESEYINAAIHRKQSAFDLGTRDKILQEINKEAIICHISQEKKLTHLVEEIFRSENKLLIDATANEFYFVLDFFGLQVHQCSYIFNAIFKKPVQFFLESMQNTANSTFDCGGLLLILIINGAFKEYLAQKNVPILEVYFDKIDFILWPRILQILDGHLNSIRQSMSKGIKPVVTTAMAITKRYVELASGIYKITKQKPQDMLMMRMAGIKSGMIELLKQISDKSPNDKQKMVFLLNNLDYICNEFKTIQLEKFEDLNAFTKEYNIWAPRFIKLLLFQEFKSLFDLVAKYSKEDGSEEGLQLVAEEEIKKVNKEYLESVGNDFACSWAKKAEAIQETINVSISSKSSAKQLYWNLLKELMAKYSAFGEIVRIGNPSYFKELNGQHVLLDLKNLSITVMHTAQTA